MKLTPSQAQIAKDLHRFRVLVCGRKFGKTSLAAEEILGAAIFKRDKRVLYLAPTFADARRLMWDRLKNRLKGVILKDNETRLEFKIRTVDGGSSMIFLGSWEIIDSYRGDEFDFIVLDEVQDYPNFWVGWREALRPTLTPRKGSALFMGTPKGFNHLYDLFNEQEESFKSFKFTSYDNPHIPVEEIDEARRQVPEDAFAQEYLAEFRKMEGLVYKEFRRELHLYDQLPEGLVFNTIIEGIDFGYTNPAAILKIGVDYDNNFYVDEEWYKKEQLDEQITEVAVNFKPTYVYPDPEAPEKIVKLKRAGLNVMEVKKGSDSIKTGIDRVRELFKQNKLKINKRCLNLIWELETYKYGETNLERNPDEKPIKMGDHAVDALRYALMTFAPRNKQVDFFEAQEIIRNRENTRSFR